MSDCLQWMKRSAISLLPVAPSQNLDLWQCPTTDQSRGNTPSVFKCMINIDSTSLPVSSQKTSGSVLCICQRQNLVLASEKPRFLSSAHALRRPTWNAVLWRQRCNRKERERERERERRYGKTFFFSPEKSTPLFPPLQHCLAPPPPNPCTPPTLALSRSLAHRLSTSISETVHAHSHTHTHTHTHMTHAPNVCSTAVNVNLRTKGHEEALKPVSKGLGQWCKVSAR